MVTITSGEPMETGLFYGISNADYHAGPGISKSGLDLIAKSPLHYWSAYLDPDRKPREETPAMRLGTAIHAAVLEPDAFKADYLPAPKIDRRTKEGKQVYADLSAMAEDRNMTLLDADEYEACQRIASQVRQHPAARALFANGVAESSVYWTDAETGVLCKCRPDWLMTAAILDVKSTEDASPSGFARSIVIWRYHVQAAWYLDGLMAATGIKAGAFLFGAFEKKPPYACGFYYADADMVELGRREYRRNLRTYADCLSSGKWPGYSTDIQPITLPAWMFNSAANDNQKGE